MQGIFHSTMPGSTGASLQSADAHSSAAARTSTRRPLVPSGFECVAHPVFFRYDDDDEVSTTRASRESGARRRSRDESARPLEATTFSTTSMEAHGHNDPDIVALSTLESDDLDDEASAAKYESNADSMSGSMGPSGKRELDTVCPICLEKRQIPVTLTSCLHTFCHTCIIGWYEHTVAVALRRGDFSRLRAQASASRRQDFAYDDQGADIAGNTRGSRSSARAGAWTGPPLPYRCPLCQVPGPFFLAVERIRPVRSNSLPGVKEKGSKLNFTLMGVRTILGGGGPGSGGIEVGRADCRSEVGYPSMMELRAAARTQLALAAAVSALEEKAKFEDCRQGNGDERVSAGEESDTSEFPRKERVTGGSMRREAGDGGSGSVVGSRHGGQETRSRRRNRRRDRDPRKRRKRHRGSTMTASEEDNEKTCASPKEEQNRCYARNSPSAARVQSSNCSDCDDSLTVTSAHIDSNEGSVADVRRIDSSSAGMLRDGGYGTGALNRFNSSVVASDMMLPLEPGAMAAEDALIAIEAMLAHERDKLRRKSGGGSLANVSSSPKTR